MKISEITSDTVKDFLRLDEGEADETLIAASMKAAENYILDETALEPEDLDDHEDLTIAYLVLVQDFYDNRAYESEKSAAPNRTVEAILGHHRRNLL